jgi:hypothetical protein
MRPSANRIHLTAHATELFLRPCPRPTCQSAALCRIDYRGSTIGNCRGCDWLGTIDEGDLDSMDPERHYASARMG